MNTTTRFNCLIDWLLFLAMVVLFATGIVLWGWKRPAPAKQGPDAKPAVVAADSKPADAKPADAQASPAREQHGAPTAGAGQGQILWGLFHGNAFLGMTKNGGWKSIHCWVGVLVLLPFFLLHIFMHWKWIVTFAFGTRTGKPEPKEETQA